MGGGSCSSAPRASIGAGLNWDRTAWGWDRRSLSSTEFAASEKSSGLGLGLGFLSAGERWPSSWIEEKP